MPKPVETRRHCEEHATTPKTKDVGRGLRKIVACSQSSSQCLLVSTCLHTVSIYSCVLCTEMYFWSTVLKLEYKSTNWSTVETKRQFEEDLEHAKIFFNLLPTS